LIFYILSFVAARPSRLSRECRHHSVFYSFRPTRSPIADDELFWSPLRRFIRQPLPDQERSRPFRIKSTFHSSKLPPGVATRRWRHLKRPLARTRGRPWSPRDDGHRRSHEGAVWQSEWIHSNSGCSAVSSVYAQSVSLGPGISLIVRTPRSRPAWFAEPLRSRLSPVGRSNRWISSSRPRCSSSNALNDRKVPRRYGRENQSGIRPHRPEVPRDVVSWPWPARSSPFPREPGRRRTSRCLRSTLRTSPCSAWIRELG